MNGRYVIDKIVQKLREKDGAENLIAELDRIDQAKNGFNEVHLSAVLSDVAGFFPDVYSDVPEAPAFVVHVEKLVKDGKIKGKGKPDGKP